MSLLPPCRFPSLTAGKKILLIVLGLSLFDLAIVAWAWQLPRLLVLIMGSGGFLIFVAGAMASIAKPTHPLPPSR
jgi:hypothetical protein